MVITSIVLAVIAGIATGWAARQRQELLDQKDQIEELLIENTEQKNTIQCHEVCLNMVLGETEELS